MIALSRITQEHLSGPGHPAVVHLVQQVKCFTLHEKHFEDEKEILFLYFFCSLPGIYSSIINYFISSQKKDTFCNVIRCSIVQ